MAEPMIITMKTNFPGLIRLLADGLYSTSDIFVRELIQNGHDSIIRRTKHQEPGYQGKISVTLNSDERSITFTDNGIGMDENDIVNFLSVIGATGTGKSRDELEEALAKNLIGQFGIGMLSSFLVASKVMVHTRKLGCSQAFEWVNTGSAQCQLTEISRKEIGSSVTVYLRSDFTYLLDPKKLTEIITRYCDFITIPIDVQNLGTVNTILAPWDKTYLSPEQEMRSYTALVKHRFNDIPLDVFPVHINVEEAGEYYRAKGVLYISARHMPGLNSAGTLDIFIRKMLVKEGDTTLLPSWAKFIQGVVDSPDLSPTAGRDNINQENTAFRVIQKALGECIIERLTYLAQHHPDRFAFINQWHHDHLKGMALVNEEFFNHAIELLLFETNRGDLSLKQYLLTNPFPQSNRIPIYYFSHYNGAAQYYRMAEDRGLVVINAGQRYDEELLEKYGKLHSEVMLEKLNELDTGVFFDELTEEQRMPFRPLEQRISYHLNNELLLNIHLTTKSFSPAGVPAVVIESDQSKTDRLLQLQLSDSGFLESFGDVFSGMRDGLHLRPIQLALNAENSLIKELAALDYQTLQSPEITKMLALLYNNALLYSHRLDEKNMNIVHDGIADMVKCSLQYLSNNQHLKQQVLQLRTQINELNELLKKTASTAAHPDHIQLFMIAPFADDYKPVEQAVRQVFEQAPFCFEVRMARDYYAADDLVDNVKKQIATAHGFVAEISEQNANVMMEVGGILMSDDPRPVFALEYPTEKIRPADFGDKLFFSYSSKSDAPEVIAREIRENLVADGRIRNARLAQLIKQRKKLFLSGTLLGNENYRLHEPEREGILKHFHTIEDLLQADKAAMEKTGVESLELEITRRELTKVLEECYGYNE